MACAEEASIRLEEGLLLPALQMIDNKDPMDEQSVEVVTEMRAMTRFLAQVCTANKYREQMQPALSRLREREAVYCEKFAQKLGCTSEELAPWFFAVVASLESYMIFGSEAFSVNPMDFTKKAMEYIKIIHNGNLSANSENKTGKFR